MGLHQVDGASYASAVEPPEKMRGSGWILCLLVACTL